MEYFTPDPNAPWLALQSARPIVGQDDEFPTYKSEMSHLSPASKENNFSHYVFMWPWFLFWCNLAGLWDSMFTPGGLDKYLICLSDIIFYEYPMAK
mmetsp:Transcript_9837/g.14889  ORF Transcript_9837/g.14889 Transcript_9837/m.14889 type:complete len:96 (-) Transcript_9837:18-305(-)